MGFLKFLSKPKKDKLGAPLEDLDMPPAPPTSLKEKLPPIPDLDEMPFAESKPKPPESLKLTPVKEPEAHEELPQIPDFAGFEEKMQHPSVKPHHRPHVPPIKKPAHARRMERAAFREERAILDHEEIHSKSTFVKVDRFKEIKRSTLVIRDDLKKADEILVKLHGIKETQNQVFNKWKSTMEDLQKKLIFVDKTLFKGD